MINETLAIACAIVLLCLIVYTQGMKIWARKKGRAMACAACGRTIVDRPVRIVEDGREIVFCCEHCAAAYTSGGKNKDKES